MRLHITCVLLFSAAMISCGGNRTAQIWTDQGEFAFYGEFFNTVQDKYKVAVKYVASPCVELSRTNSYPDIVVGSWLKNASTKILFKSIDNLFGAKKLSRSVFYQQLLAAGRIDRNQYLLPVSFNIPALIFSRDKERDLSSQFTIGFDEIKDLGGKFNTVSRGAYTRMGFSPLWSDGFLFTAAVLYGSSFTEANPLAWNAAALESSMDFVYKWTNEINTSGQAEEEFAFKYFFEPPQKLIQSGRILFSHMESSSLFTLSQNSKNAIDFRWIMEKNRIPITEDTIFLGLPKKGKAQRAARAFIQWFFNIESQRLLLEYAKSNRINETVFGICGGFSALTPVTEQVFPIFYPELLGRMPPHEFLQAPNVLPVNWATIKERVILPYLQDRARKENAEEAYPLERRLSDWQRMNR